LFGASVNLAARICAHAGGGQTLVSSTVRDLAIGKGIDFRPMGEIGLKGFPDPVALFEVAWAEST
jgi:class 3 adenylate cyclase